MARYIDVDKTIEVIKNDALEIVYYNKQDAIDCLNSMPTADVVEVVRCKDCVYYTNNINNPNLRNGYCNLKKAGHFYTVKDTDYCIYGQKKEEN